MKLLLLAIVLLLYPAAHGVALLDTNCLFLAKEMSPGTIIDDFMMIDTCAFSPIYGRFFAKEGFRGYFKGNYLPLPPVPADSAVR